MTVVPGRRAAAILLVLCLAIVACGGSTPSGTPAGTSTATQGAATDAAPSDAPTDGGQATPPPDPGTGTQGDPVPALGDGNWTAGRATAEVTGDVTASLAGEILQGLATTSGGNTSLVYIDQTNGTQIAVAMIEGGTASVSLATTEWVGGGGTTTDAQCTADFTAGDANKVAGTIRCSRAPIIDTGGQADRFADMVVTFEATR